MAKVSIKKDDYVMVIAGKDKGKTAQVLAVDSKKLVAMIEGKGITPRKKAVKARKASDRSGIIDFPALITISNLMPICSACDKPTRVGHKIVDGKKERVCIKCGEILKTKKVEEKKAAATVRKRSKKAVEAKDEEVKTEAPEVKEEETQKPKVEATATKAKKTTKTAEKPAEKKVEKPVEKKAEEKPAAKKAEENTSATKKPAASAKKAQPASAKKTTATKKVDDKSDKDKKE